MRSGQDISRFQRNPKIEEAPLQTELMLFDPESSKFYVLNQTMAWVWKNLSRPELDDLAAELSNSFSNVTREQAIQDIDAALAELAQLGLVLDH